MSRPPRPFLWLLSLALIIAGGGLLWLAYAGWQAGESTLGRPSLTSGAGPGDRVPTLSEIPSDSGSAAVQNAADPSGEPVPPTVTPETVRLALPADLPLGLQNHLLAWLEQEPGSQLLSDRGGADLWLEAGQGDRLLMERFYVPVTRFATLQDNVGSGELRTLWQQAPANGAAPLVVDEETAAALRLLWGTPAQVDVVPNVTEVVGVLYQDGWRLGIVPFAGLVPQLRALSLDGNRVTDNRFRPADYPLALRLYVSANAGKEQAVARLQAYVEAAGLTSNRDPQKLTVLVMTGVTAMARVTGLRMEQKGIDYPALVVGPELSAADLTHISNEIPFVEGCQVDPSVDNLTLCSSPCYLAALRAVGVDLVGLTGNHLNDFGAEASLQSLQFYAQEGLPTYGGGADDRQALQPLLLEHNGNRLAFLGANAFGPPFAWAGPDWPGSARYDQAQMIAAIAAARQELEADLVLVELQWEESYDTLPLQSQQAAFPVLSAAGADLVTGVQSHVPQAAEFGQGGLILYGLGNFFFDQMWSLPTRQGLIPRHTIYDGRHLNTELLVTVLEDYAQPRWATEEERATVLGRVFEASGW